MLTKLANDHKIIHSPFCGELREILSPSNYSPDIVVALDIRLTTAHYHKRFDEIYLVLDGELVLQFYEPEADRVSEQKLGANELCVIYKGIHHRVKTASKKNRLCVISVPNFDGSDEHKSEVI